MKLSEHQKAKMKQDRKRVTMWNQYINGKIGERKICEWFDSDIKHITDIMNKIRENNPDMRVEYRNKAWRTRTHQRERSLYNLRERYMQEDHYRRMAHENWPAFLRELGVSI